MTRRPLSDLALPFPARDIEWRAQSTGQKDNKPWIRVLAYIDNRAIMTRLDDVCGPEHWRNEYRQGPSDGSILCGLSIRVVLDEGLPYGEWVTKWDGAENTDIEAVKGGLSSAMKRAAYQWGIGRYLYDLEEGFGIVSPNGQYYCPAKPEKHGPAFKWNPPALPAWALPTGGGRPDGAKEPEKAAASQPGAAIDVLVPGTKAHFQGYGGRRLGDLDTSRLEIIQQDLKTVGSQKYVPVIEAIGVVLADRASA